MSIQNLQDLKGLAKALGGEEWQQGRLLVTPITRRWSQAKQDREDRFERRRVFAGFSARDEGRGRTSIAIADSESLAAFIAAANPAAVLELIDEIERLQMGETFARALAGPVETDSAPNWTILPGESSDGDHERIYLQPACCASPDVGRMWCQDPDPENCEDGKPWTEYVRADLAIGSFQQRVAPWMQACFGPEISADRIERNFRFLEEALELVQACGCTADEVRQLVDYTFGRPIGEPGQEVGGVMVTLAALCLGHGLDMHEAADTELARIWKLKDKIRAKHDSKKHRTPLPGETQEPIREHCGGHCGINCESRAAERFQRVGTEDDGEV